MKTDARSGSLAAPGGEDILALARSGNATALEQLGEYSIDQLAQAVTALRPREQAEFLELVEQGPEIVPLLPEAVFASTVVATGLEHAGWLVEHATAEQRIAAVDLDCWKDHRFSPSRLFEWLDAIIEAGTETLVAAFDELDPEIWILAMKEMADFSMLEPGIAEIPSLDGMIGYDPASTDHEDRLRRILGTALVHSPGHYWDFVYGAMSESRQACEDVAARWQRGRLDELGFPDREQAMGVYRPLRAEAVPVPPCEGGEAETRALVAARRPPALLAGTRVGQALAELPPERAAQVFGAILSVANALAVADELPLAEPDSVTRSLKKALQGIERGLAELAKLRGESLATVLAGVPALDLFRIGAPLEGDLRRSKTLAELAREESGDDWNVPIETIDPEDQVVGEDGRLRR